MAENYRGIRLIKADGEGDTGMVKAFIDACHEKSKFKSDLRKIHTIEYGDVIYANDGTTPCGTYAGGKMKLATRFSRRENFHTFLHELGHAVGGWMNGSEEYADDYADSWDDWPEDAEPAPKPQTQPQTQTRSKKPMALFPFLKPTESEQAEDMPQQQAIAGASGMSPLVAGYIGASGYSADLGITDPTLEAANQVLAQRHQQVAAISETDKLVSELVKLDEAEVSAKTSLHGTLSKHQQFLAKNQGMLQAINQAHVLGMAGHSQTQQVQAAKFNGLVSARSAIAARMRGGAA